jgi:hypothetical protein
MNKVYYDGSVNKLTDMQDPSVDSNSIIFNQKHNALINDLLNDEDDVHSVNSGEHQSIGEDSNRPNNRGTNSLDRQNLLQSSDQIQTTAQPYFKPQYAEQPQLGRVNHDPNLWHSDENE